MASPVLLPLPGTVGGEGGYYIDRMKHVGKWEVTNGVWRQLPLLNVCN